MRTELKERILGCLGKVLSISVETLEPRINLRDELGMDSLAMVMLQVEIEEEFRFTFDPIEDDFERIFETFESLYNYLENRG